MLNCTLTLHTSQFSGQPNGLNDENILIVGIEVD